MTVPLTNGGPALLEGVRVVDLTDDYGSYASRLLAELGAEVVRVEASDGGAGRRRAPFAETGESLHHLHRNVGKVCVRGADPEAVDGLLANADIAFCQHDAEQLAAAHPHLVVVGISAFGTAGPASGWQSTELVAQAIAGVVHRAGVPELPPVAPPGSYCEDVGAVSAALAALLGLRQARADGHGQVIDVSAILALGQCTDTAIPLWSLLRADQQRAGAGAYPLFECTDGLARTVLPMSTGEWRSLITWLGSPPDWTGPNWETPMLGPAERALVLARLPERFASATRDEIAADGDAAGVRITPVLTPAEVLTNEHVSARGTFASIPVGGSTAKIPSAVFSVDGRRLRLAPESITDVAPAWPTKRPATEPATPTTAGRSSPLAGLRVLEVGTGVAGPEAGRILGEWGADVIKVESGRRPDFYRKVMGGDMNPAFASSNRNKRAFAADLGTESGRSLVREMIPHIDIIIENNASGVLDRLGLGYEDVTAINPRIIVVSSQLYGARGPWANKKGYGPSARAIAGLTWLWAHGPDAPRGVQTIHPDHLAGRLIAVGTLAALTARDVTGRGSHVDVAQFEAIIALLGDVLAGESLAPGSALPQGNSSAQHAPWGLFRCADDEHAAQRWIAICAPDDASWAALAAAAPAGLDRAGWSTEAQRLADAAAIEQTINDWVRECDAGELEGRLQRAGVAAGQALFPRTQADHPAFAGRDFLVPVDQPGVGPLLFEGPAFIGSGLGDPLCGPAPLPGQHTIEICAELLGMNDTDVRQLVERGAIDDPPPTTRPDTTDAGATT